MCSLAENASSQFELFSTSQQTSLHLMAVSCIKNNEKPLCEKNTELTIIAQLLLLFPPLMKLPLPSLLAMLLLHIDQWIHLLEFSFKASLAHFTLWICFKKMFSSRCSHLSACFCLQSHFLIRFSDVTVCCDRIWCSCVFVLLCCCCQFL